MSDVTTQFLPGWNPVKASHALDGNPDRLRQFYQKWASRYDEDVRDQGYVAPEFMANLLQDLEGREGLTLDTDDRELPILDAGCGTGLVGIALRNLGYANVEGFDLSEEMAGSAARTGAYRTVRGGIDICKPLDVYDDEQFAAVICCGVFTLGHVSPSALRKLVPITRRGGVIQVSTRKSYYEESSFAPECRAMEKEGLVTRIGSVMNGPYIDEEDAHYWVLRRN